MSSNARARSGKSCAGIGSGAAIAERVLAQEIEIAAAVGLQDLAAVEPCIAALRHRSRCRLAPRQFLRRDEEVEAPILDREADGVAPAHPRPGPPPSRPPGHQPPQPALSNGPPPPHPTSTP